MGETWFEALRGLEERALAARRAAGFEATRRTALEELDLAKQTVSGWLKDIVAREFDSVWPLIERYLSWAAEPYGAEVQRHWATLHESARERRVAVDDGGDWAALVRDSPLWQRVDDPGRLREQAAALAAGLARGIREADRDPWWDPRLPHRFVRQTEALVDCMRLERLEAAEVALFVLLPLLYCAYQADLSSRLAGEARPGDLAEESGERPERSAFRTFLAGHPWLVRRALQGELPGRTSAPREIGWWLFHRWLSERHTATRPQVAALLDGAAGAGLADVLDPSLVIESLRLVRRGPSRLVVEELSGLGARVWLGPAGRETLVRARLVGLTLAAAHALALELSDLPMVLVEHLGVPYAVDLDTLRSALGLARWVRYGEEDPPRGLVLQIDCADPATLQAMREQVEHVDAVLRAVHRLSGGRECEALAALPTHASAHQVEPVRNGDGERRFSGVSTRFTVDERRLRELLMGSQLYGSPELAIRELYQNALDACRYREARIRYRYASIGLPVPPGAYRGEIGFTQGVDEQGRAYLECRDNGVGMGEQQLAGVFSRAGVSFTGTEEYVEERAEWERCGVEMFPNSRFGIGVLSYFMLADEIRVTSCRMNRVSGEAGPVLEASVAGPGHLFHVEYPTGRPSQPGTTVRLYLRPGALSESSVGVLRKQVRICEFAMTAQDTDRLRPRFHRWDAGAIQAVAVRSGESGSEVIGPVVYGPLGPDGRVIWCRSGGGVLVDGIRVKRPDHPGFAFDESTLARSTPSGVVIDLRGPRSVALSVDRTRIVEDIADRIDTVVRDGVAALVGDPDGPLTFEWLCELARTAPRFADTVAEEAIRQGVELPVASQVFRVAATGVFPADPGLLGLSHRQGEGSVVLGLEALVPDHVLLWRVLAHDGWDAWPGLAEVVPHRDTLPPVRPALPSDQRLLMDGEEWRADCVVPHASVIDAAEMHGWPVDGTAVRIAALGLRPPAEEALARIGSLDPGDLELRLHGLDPGRPVPLRHVVDVHLRCGMSVREVTERLRRFGLKVDAAEAPVERADLISLRLLDLEPRRDRGHSAVDRTGKPLGQLAAACLAERLDFAEAATSFSALRGSVDWGPLPERPEEGDPVLLSANLDGRAPWLPDRRRVPAIHVLLAAQLLDRTPAAVARRLLEYGIRSADPGPAVLRAEIDRELVSAKLTGEPPWLDLAKPVSQVRVAITAGWTGRSVAETADALRAYGFVVPTDDAATSLTKQEADLLRSVVGTDSEPVIEVSALRSPAKRLGLSVEEACRAAERAGVKVLRHQPLVGASFLEEEMIRSLQDRRRPLAAGDTVPYRTVLTRVWNRGIPVERAIGWLNGLGVDVVPGEPGGSAYEDAVLLGLGGDGLPGFRSSQERPGLVELLLRARQLNWTVQQVADRLRFLGVEVTEPAELVRAALARVPWAPQEEVSS